jgi:uncharacterized protein (PEP-CTERM system associated)
LKLAHLTVLMSVLSMPLTAEIELLPFLSTSSHGYGVKQGAADTDRGFAQSINPGLNLQYQGSWLQSNLAVDHQALVYRDEQRENESYSSFNLDNRASFLRDQLQFQLSSSRSFRAAGNQFARYADEITNGDQMAKMDSHRANVMFSNTKLDWLHAKFNVGVGDTATDRVSDPLLNDPTLTAFDLNNRQFNGNLQLNSARRDSLIFWDLAVNAAKTDRDTELDYYNRSGAATLGFTVLPGLALIGRGSYESNSNISLSEQYDNFRNFETVGAGLEWKISSRSWWNLTYNKIDDERGGTEYIGTEFNFQPSRRTQLNGSLDRRFFGRTAQVSGSYRLKNINMQLSFSDSVDSLLGFATNNPLFGLFVCPPGAAATLDNCILPPTPNYQLKPGEFPAAIQLPTDNLNESLVIRRNASYSLGYQFNRLKLQLQLGARRDIYLERDAETKDTYVNLSGSWQLSARNTLSMGTSLSDIKYLSDEIGSAQGLGQREGVQGSAELGFSRQMNSQLTGTLTARHVKVDFKQTEQDYRENRLSLDFSFKF